MTAIFLAGAAMLFLKGWRNNRRQSKRSALFLLLTMLLGPGLLVNAVLKEHAGRPRPRAVVEFGGEEQYRAPWHFGGKGHSFPCGHCSVAFCYGAFYPLLSRRKRGLGLGILLSSVVGGCIIGVGRMAAGAHFLSDIVWAGLIVWAVIAALVWAMRPKPLAPRHEGPNQP